MKKYKTTDISLATALISYGCKMVDVKSIGYSQAEFEIQHPKIEQLVVMFYNRDLMLDAMTMFDTHKTLKARVNDTLRNHY